MSLLIKNARVVNAKQEDDRTSDILVEKDKIMRMSPQLEAGRHRVVDAKGQIVMPGLIDMHVHLREPGREDKETIESGSRAAVQGGFTSLVCMPNTKPVIDNVMVVEGVMNEARRVGLVNVFPAGAITKGQQGEELVDMLELKEAGCLTLTDDGKAVLNSQTMRLALDYSQMAGLLLMQHCQDAALSSGGVMNEGLTSTLLGMRGDPVVAETVIVARDIELAHYLNVPVHLQHISSKRAVQLIRQAKAEGIPVTAEVTPHHLLLTDDAVKSFNPNMKVNPPLRTAEDTEALKQGLRDGTLDCLATDHAPHTVEDKEKGFDDAPFGMVGLETALGLVITHLLGQGILTWPALVEKMSLRPAQLLGLSRKGVIAEGYDADLIIVDPEAKWTVRSQDFVSKARNSPYLGWELHGQVLTTINGGKIVYQKVCPR